MKAHRSLFRLPSVCILAVLFTTLPHPAGAEPITVQPDRVGFMRHSDLNNRYEHIRNLMYVSRSSAGGSNYYNTRSYALFNMSPFYGRRMISAQLKFAPSSLDWYSYNDQALESFGLYHIYTDPQAFMDMPEAYGAFYLSLAYNPQGKFGDLGAGDVYGTGAVTPGDIGSTMSIPLSASALTNIKDAGGLFAIGFRPTSEAAPSNKEYIQLSSVRIELVAFGAPVNGGGGLAFELGDPEQEGGGGVIPTLLGASHAYSVTADAATTPVSEYSEMRQLFVFQAGGSTVPRPVYLAGHVTGTLSATYGGATVQASVQLREANDTVLDSASYSNHLDSLSTGDPHSLPVDDYMHVSAVLTPDQTYKLVSRMDLSAYSGGAGGTGTAAFGDTFVAELSGTPVRDLRIESTPEGDWVFHWISMHTGLVFTVQSCTDLAVDDWQPVAPTNQWPIIETTWTHPGTLASPVQCYRVVTDP